MALDKTTLINSLRDAFSSRFPAHTCDLGTKQYNQMNDLAQKMADAIDVYLTGAEIIYAGGLIAPSGGGAVTGPGSTTTIGNLK